MANPTSERIAELDHLKTGFSRGAAGLKVALLRDLTRRPIAAPRQLVAYHETLCFLRAFPDHAELLALAEAELRRFARRVEHCREAHGGELPASLVDTGIAGTPFHYPYGFPMVRWLVDRFGDAVEVDWEEYDESGEDALSPVVIPQIGWAETTALDDEGLTLREWFEAARGNRKISFLRWLVEQLRASDLSNEVQETLYDEMALSIRWELGSSPASRTLARMPGERRFYHAGPMRRRTGDLRAEILRPLEKSRPVGRRRARTWIDLARCALSARDRELYPIALASEAEVYEANVGRGVTIVVFGMLPDRRLPLESDYGAFVVKNGMPIGYGVGALLLDRIELAVNIFPTFRQGESSFVFEQFNRLFHHQFGCRIFMVERYQLGHENDEGLESGAFWFFYKLGFRPIDPRVAALAEEEARRLGREAASRSSRRMLRRLVRSNTILHLDERDRDATGEISITKISLCVSRYIEGQFGGDRRRAERVSARRLARTLEIDDLDAWSESERRAFVRLSPLFAILPGLGGWTKTDKRALRRVLRAKGGAGEGRFARGMASLRRLHRAFEELSRP